MYKLSEDLWGYKDNPFEMKAEVSEIEQEE
jgi:hypothetical protein